MNKKFFMLLTSLIGLSFVFLESASTPNGSRVYADRFVEQIEQTQEIGQPGTLDDTFGNNGSLRINQGFGDYSIASAIKVLHDGSIVVVIESETESTVVKYRADGSVDESFATDGMYTLSGYRYCYDIIIDADNNILLMGEENGVASTPSWIFSLTSDGQLNEEFEPVLGDSWDVITSGLQLSNGNFVFGGQNSGNNYPRLSSYTPAGQLNENFGVHGTIVFDGENGMPSAGTVSTYAIASNSLDQIYVAYKNATVCVAKFNSGGQLIGTFGSNGVLRQALGSSLSFQEQIEMVIDSASNIYLAGTLNDEIVLHGYDADGISLWDSSVTLSLGETSLELRDLIALDNDTLIVIAQNITDRSLYIASVNNDGTINSDFNGSGYLQVQVINNEGFYYTAMGSVAPDGRLYTVHNEFEDDQYLGYVSRIINELYVGETAQYSTTFVEGDLDLDFGDVTSQTYRGVSYLFNGKYGSHLAQQPNAVIVVQHDEENLNKIIVGMHGKTNTSALSHIMLARMDQDGILDSTFGLNGFLTLEKMYDEEFITNLLEDENGNIYVCGYAFAEDGGHAILRKLSSSGIVLWPTEENPASESLDGNDKKVLGIGIQSSQRIIAFMQDDDDYGAVRAYNPTTGALDVTFNAPYGEITVDSFYNEETYRSPLEYMGPIYGFAIEAQNNILIAYKNDDTDYIDAVYIDDSGSHLISQFGVNGIAENICGLEFYVDDYTNLRLALDNTDKFIIAFGKDEDFYAYRFFVENGQRDTTFGNDGYCQYQVNSQARLYNMVVSNSNQIILVGSDNDQTGEYNPDLFIARINSEGIIDPLFNQYGDVPGVLSFHVSNVTSGNYSDRVVTGLAIQPTSGNMVVVGYEEQRSSDATPMVARIMSYGDGQVSQSPVRSDGVAGTIDTSFGNEYGTQDFTDLLGSGSLKVVLNYPSDHEHAGKIIVGMDTVDQTVILARLYEHDLSLDETFGTDGITTLISIYGLSGLHHLSLDAQDNIIASGSFDNKGWAKRIDSDGILDVEFVPLTGLIDIYAVYEQNSGRYIACGRNSLGRGTLVAFQNKIIDDYLQVDTTFNPLGVTAGWYPLGTTGLYNVVIHEDDTIFTAYADINDSNIVKITKITANGSGVVESFAGGVVDTGISPKNTSEIRIALDNDGKVYVASSVGTGGTAVQVACYGTDGIIDPLFDQVTISGIGSIGVSLSSILVTTDNKVILSGFNTAGANGKIFIVRLTDEGSLDPIWNVNASGSDVPGVLTFSNVNSFAVYNATIFVEGSIFLAGVGSTNIPLLHSVFGDSYIMQAEQHPQEAPAGTLDYTLDSLTPGSGALNLQEYLSDFVDLTNFYGHRIHIYEDGSMLLGFSNNSDEVIVVKLKADRSVDTSFNQEDTPGYISLQMRWLYEMTVVDGENQSGNIYLGGRYPGDERYSVIYRITSQGVDTGFQIIDELSERGMYTIRETSNGRILFVSVRQSDEQPVIVAYKADGSGRDLTFGNDGEYVIENSDDGWWLDSSSLDSQDRMYYSYWNDHGYTPILVTERLQANGTAIDDAWSSDATFVLDEDSPDVDYIRTVLDEDHNKVIVVASSDGGFIYVRYYNATNGDGLTDAMKIALENKYLKISDVFFDQEGYAYIVGLNETDYNIIALRYTPDMELDSSYAQDSVIPGLADLNAGSHMNYVYAGGYHPDRRVYILGGYEDDEIVYPSLAAIFGDFYSLEESQTTFQAVQGTLDITIDPNEEVQDAGILLSSLDESIVGASAKSIFVNSDGSYIIACNHQNGIDAFLIKLNPDQNLHEAFGYESTPGITGAYTMPQAVAVISDEQERFILVGMNNTQQKVLRFDAQGQDATIFNVGDDTNWILTAVTGVVQQRSGMILVSGKNSSSGILLAYKFDPSSDNDVATTFGSVDNPGCYLLGIDRQIDDVVVNRNDEIFITYRDESNYVWLQKINAQGSAVDIALNTGILANNSAKITINESENILIAAPVTTGVSTVLYDGEGLSGVTTQAISPSFVLADTYAAQDSFIVAGYTTTPSMIVIRFDEHGTIDPLFNPQGTTPGIATLRPEGVNSLTGLSVQPDGKIVMVGLASSDSVFMSVYGAPYVYGHEQYPSASQVGTLDTTLHMPDGDLNLDTLLSLDLDGYIASRVHVLEDHRFMIVFENGTDVIVAMLHNDFTLDTSFNEEGYNQSGYKIFEGISTVRDLYRDENDRMYMVGGSATSWVKVFNIDGSDVEDFDVESNMSLGAYSVALQNMDGIVVSGQDEYGVVYRYASTTGELDSTFGNSDAGVFTTNIAKPIADISVDSQSRIVFACNNGSNSSLLGRIYFDGSSYDALETPTSISNLQGDQLQVIHDVDGNIILAAATLTGFEVRRYNTNGQDFGDAITILTTEGSANLAALYATLDQNITLIGYDADTHEIIVARINSDFMLDPLFNAQGDQPGILRTMVGDMGIAKHGALYNDARIFVVGGNVAGDEPYMCRVFGDSYSQEVLQSDLIGSIGTLQDAYGQNGAISLTSSLGTSIPYAILAAVDGNVFVGSQDSITGAAKILKMNDLGQPVSAFGYDEVNSTGSNNGITSFINAGHIRDLQFDHAGYLLATGGINSNVFVYHLNPTTGAFSSFADATLMKTSVKIGEQMNDRIIIVGSNGADNGMVAAFIPTGESLDTTFGVDSDGYFYDEINISEPITSFAIDSVDRIFVGYTKDSRAAVACILPNGTGLDIDADDYVGFASTGFIGDVFGETSISGNVYVAVDNLDNVIVAAVNNSGGNIVVQSFDRSGTPFATAVPVSLINSPVLTGMMVSQENKIVLFGNTGDNSVFTMQFTSDLIPDANFGIDGNGISTFTIDGINTAYSGSMVVNGTMYVAGNNAEIDPIIMSIFADRFVGENDQQPTNALAGSFDLSLNSTGRAVLADRSGDLSLQIARFVATDETTGKMLVLFDNGTNSILGRLNPDGFVDTSFGVDGFSSYTMPPAARSLTIDRDGHILACGDTWLAHYEADGSDVNVFQTPQGFQRGSQIRAQTTGRYIICGYDTENSSGSLIGYTREFVMDPSFGSLTLESPINNRFITGVDAIINSCVVMNDDTIVCAYNTPSALILSKVNPSGSELVESFGDSGSYQALPGIAVSGKAFVIKDENQNLIVAAKTNTNEISVRRYDADATASDRFVALTITNPTLAAIEQTATGQIIVSGYSGTDNVFVARLLAADFSLDTSFGDGGLFESQCTGLTAIHSAAIRADGKVVLVGQDVANNGLLVSVNADPYVTRNVDAVQYPSEQGDAGDLNTNFGQDGVLDIDFANLNLEYARHIYTYTNGKKIIACNNGTQTTVMRLHKDNSLDTSFGNDGSETGVYTSGAGYISLMNAGVVNDMFVNDGTNGDDSIYLVGDYAGVWYAQISHDGEFLGFDASNPSSLIDAWRIFMGTDHRLYIAGQTETSGIIQALQPFVGIDLSFGNGDGTYQTGVASPLMDMAVDSYDRKYIAFLDGDVIKVQRILPNGSAQDLSFIAENITGEGLSGTQIRLDLNSSEQYVYVAVQDWASVFVYRYETESGDLVGSVNFAGEAYFTLQDLFIDDTEFGYVVGYINGLAPFVGRFNAFANASSITLDETYGDYYGSSIFFDIPMLAQAGIVDLDGNVYVVGHNDGATDVKMICLYGDNYNLESAESNTLGLPGVTNRTINPTAENYDDRNARVLSDDANFGSVLDGYTARLIYANTDGSSYIAFGNGTYVMIGKIDSDYYPVLNFGNNGLTSPISMAVVNSLSVDSQERIFVAGTQAGASYAVRFAQSGSSYETFSGAPTLVVGTTLCEQKSGRVLLAGRKVADAYSDTAAGVIIAYRHTADATDVTFGPAALDGFYTINVNQQIDDMVVNDQDDIFIVYRDSTVKVQKVMQDGSGKDAEFNEGATLDTGFTPTSAPVIAINDSQNILVAVTTSSGVQTILYDGTTGEEIDDALLLDGTLTPVATDIVAAQDDFIVTVYTSQDARAYKVLGESGLVDTDFGNAGVFVSSSLSVSQILDAAVQPHGTILMVGNAVVESETSPLIMSCYGTPFVSEFKQFPLVQYAGTFDNTLHPDLGDFDLYDAYSSANLSGFSVKKIHMYADGDMLFACDNGSQVRMIAVHKDLTLDTTMFDGLGYATLDGIDTVRSLHVDNNGLIYVAGGYNGGSSLVMMYADGTVLTNSEINLDQEGVFVGTQSFGRTLLAGQHEDYPIILGYNRSGTLDGTFAADGSLLLPNGQGVIVTGFVIDQVDNIIYAAVDSGSSVIGMYDQTGKIYYTMFDEVTPITGIVNNELKIIQDAQGNIIVVAAVSGGYQVRKYDLEEETSSYININVNYAHLSKVYMTDDNKIVIIGYTDYENMVVIRITEDLVLDTTFNYYGSPAGVLVRSISDRMTIHDGMVYDDNRIYCVGGGWNDDNRFTPYMNRVYGDDYVNPQEQVAFVATPGTLDITFGDDANGAINLADFDVNIGESIPKSLLVKDDGSIIVAMQNDEDEALVVSLQNSLGLQAPSLITATQAAGLETLFEDENLNLMIAGNTGSSSWVQRFDGLSGQTYGTFPIIPSMTSVVGLLSSSVGRLIAGGRQDSTHGVLIGLTPLSFVDNNEVDDALFDVSFGNNGRFTHSLMMGADDFVIDPYDKILVSFVVSGIGKIARVLPNGSDLDLGFSSSGTGVFTTNITNIIGADSMRIAIDNDYQVVCAAVTTAGIVIFRYEDDSMTSTNVGLTITQETTGLVNPVIRGILTTTTNQIILYGYEDTEGGLLYILRLTSDGNLDYNFNPQGTYPCVLTYEIDHALAVKRVYDAVISPEGRILSAVFEGDNE